MPRTPRPGAHEALLEAARAEFARRGLEPARVEDIARRAGISKGAFYLHFRSKDAAFQELLQRFLGALEEHARSRHEAEERFARERGRAMGRAALARQLEFEASLDAAMLEVLWRNRHLLRVVDAAAGKPYVRLVGDFRRRMRSLLVKRIAERQAAGQIRSDVDAEIVGDVIVGSYEDLARRMADMAERPDLVAWARSLLVVLYEGMLARPARRRVRPAPPGVPVRAAVPKS